MINDDHIILRIREAFGPGLLSSESSHGMLSLTVSPEVILPLARLLKETPDLGFSFLTDLCGIHYPDQSNPLGVVYHFHNMQEGTRLRIKTFLPSDAPSIPTLSGLFSAANWMERETYDFYGILFTGHPNLSRILNVEYLDYFPLRKEYPLEDPTREDKDNRFFGREEQG